ncbi:MAG TPA: lysophospholipid acyltransferase family protein [Casimicrobiaceae bacterium]|jgi:KDO2-lipid IV(A) lauroyltransferase
MKSVLRFLARLPLPLLYGLGTFAYVLTFHVLRWRRDLAARNLAAAFPDKSQAERDAIMRRNYRNLGEVLAEIFWGFGATAAEMTGRVTIENRDLVERFVAEKRSVLLLTAHMCNWEWLLPAGGAQFGIPIDTVYKPLRVEALDEFVREARSRFGGKPIAMKSFLFELMRRAGHPHAYAMVADQTPLRKSEKHWTRFLNQDTAFFIGADKITKFLEAPVVYVAMRRVSRGRYRVQLEVLCEPPYDPDAPLPVMELFARRLEEEIRASPADWLWVHNKWKYPKPPDA